MGKWLVANWPDHGGDPSSGHTSSAGTAHHQTELNSLLDILLAANLDLPTRGSRVSWDDFFLGGGPGKYGAGELEARNKRGKHTALRADDMVGYVRKRKARMQKEELPAQQGRERKEGEGATLLRFST